jgi:hypothetical protein
MSRLSEKEIVIFKNPDFAPDPVKQLNIIPDSTDFITEKNAHARRLEQ